MNQRRVNVAFLLTQGSFLYSSVGPLEMLKSFNSQCKDDPVYSGGFNAYTVSQSRKEGKTACGVNVVPDYDFYNCPDPDVVWVSSQLIIEKRVCSGSVCSWLAKQKNKGAKIVSVCTGAFLLADCGLFSGEAATTHWDYAHSLQERYPDINVVANESLVVSSNFITTGAGFAWQQAVLKLVEIYKSRYLSSQISESPPVH
ncbi:MAG: hypothetical protein CL537_17085 [Alcanivoracaceae bacterium]|nr:hypothetical protein [Alcanivoracaceae bacterium]|tara:strand:- start:165 stop:764 length:600 start_codon:yes stop_codon:yes gene_type:complete